MIPYECLPKTMVLHIFLFQTSISTEQEPNKMEENATAIDV